MKTLKIFWPEIMILSLVLSTYPLLWADPNTPPVNPYDVASLRPLTEYQKRALAINGKTLQQVVDFAMKREMQKARRTLAERLTNRKTVKALNELKTLDVNDVNDPNKP